jgi:DNA-binding response OmpR family regulator
MECETWELLRVAASQIGRVVLVDDDPVCLAALEQAFRRRNVSTVSFEDGAEAWRSIQAAPDVFLAIVNWMLPGLDGHRICRWLAQQSPATTTVLMVGRAFVSEAWGKMGFRPHRILPKPFVTAQIDQEVGRIMALASGRAARKT